MKKLLSLITFTLITVVATAQTDSAKSIHIFGDHLSMAIPADVNEMSADMIRIKYHKAKDANTNFYGDADASFSIVSSVIVPGNVKEEDMVLHKDDFLAGIKAKHKLESEEVRTVNKHKLIVISFYSDVTDGRVLNKRFFAVVSQKLVSVEMNTTEATLAKRGSQMEAAISSVIIK
jgi:hypothetical protein